MRERDTSTTTPADIPPLLLNVKQVAAMLGLGERTVWRMASSDKLPRPISMGGRRLWHRPTLESFIAERAAECEASP